MKLNFKVLLGLLFICSSILCNGQAQLWGTTSQGGSLNIGTIFNLDTAGNNYSLVYDWNSIVNGNKPTSPLIQASNGNLYGITLQNGSNFGGVLYQYNYVTGHYSKLHDFADPIGSLPEERVFQASNGKLYGMTGFGGAFSLGVLYQYDLNTSTYSVLADFDNTIFGGAPHGSVIEANNGKLYGMNSHGGLYGHGVLFEYDTSTLMLTPMIDLDSTNSGLHPYGGLTLASNGLLYGMVYQGGDSNFGVLFDYDPSTNTLTKRVDFAGVSNGSYPYGNLIEASNGRLYGVNYEGGINNDGTLFEFNLTTNLLTKLADFNSSTIGANPKGSLIQSSNGKLYGYTSLGGTSNKGTVFEYDILLNTLVKKMDFTGSNGEFSQANSFIEICAKPTITIANSGLDSVCLGDSLNLLATGSGTGYSWNSGISNGIYFTPSISFVYAVTSTNTCGTSTDSISIIVSPSYNLTIEDSICSGSSYAFPDSSIQTNITSSTSQASIFSTSEACDSIITTNLTVFPVYSFSQPATICGGASFTFPDGSIQTNITSSTSYNSVLISQFGCDSIIQTNISVNPSYFYSFVDSICSGESYLFPDGSFQNNIISSLVQQSIFPTGFFCDSIYETTLVVETTDTNVAQSGASLMATTGQDSYQWIDCLNANLAIVGEINESFTAVANGSYAVVISNGSCIDTSGCKNVTSIGLWGPTIASFNIYPNPVNSTLTIESSSGQLIQFVIVRDIEGSILFENRLSNVNSTFVDMEGYTKGLYILEIKSGENLLFYKLVKN